MDTDKLESVLKETDGSYKAVSANGLRAWGESEAEAVSRLDDLIIKVKQDE